MNQFCQEVPSQMTQDSSKAIENTGALNNVSYSWGDWVDLMENNTRANFNAQTKEQSSSMLKTQADTVGQAATVNPSLL